MCGEKCATRWQKPKALGSPPRMRGKAASGGDREPGAGITPAYAGKSDPEKQPGAARWDHPRVCGEKKRLQPTITAQPGSPPRVRGKVPVCCPEHRKVRITPAYAGKSSPGSAAGCHARDHPRVCGEKMVSMIPHRRSRGSPPRVRGKVQPLGERGSQAGITPAYAGKSVHRSGLHRTEGDHPRVCGEKIYPLLAIASPLGSPPRVRGKVCDLTIIRVHHGITPAYAGKRLKRSHSIGHFSCILCLFHSVLHRASVSGGSRAGPRAPPCLPAQNTVPV